MDMHDHDALEKAALELADGGKDPGFSQMLSGEASRELAERVMVSCISMAIEGRLNGNATGVVVMATRILHQANSRAALYLWEQIAEDFIKSRKWDEKVMIAVGQALLESSSSWSGWGNVLTMAHGEECKDMARGAMASASARTIGPMLYAASRRGHVDKPLLKIIKEKFDLRSIGTSVSAMAPPARDAVRELVCSNDDERSEFNDGIKQDEMEDAAWQPQPENRSLILGNRSARARFAEKTSKNSES